MNKKIENYIKVLFQDVPRSRKATELKEELLANCNEKFEAYLKEGMSENKAYTAVVASLGDIDELLAELKPDPELKKEVEFYRTRKAKHIALAVMAYICSVAFLIGVAAIGFEELALCGMLIICALATGLIVYTNLSVPKELVRYVNGEEDNFFAEAEKRGVTPERRSVYRSILSMVWMIILAVYFLISFATQKWYITWVIFPLGGAVDQFLRAYWGVKDNHE